MRKISVLLVCLLLVFSVKANAVERVIVSLLLDESGSMNSVKRETLQGLNGYIKSLEDQEKRIVFSLYTFNSMEMGEIYYNEPIDRVREVGGWEYNPQHWTPLYDSIAEIIDKTDVIKDDEECKTLVVILTDGKENDSKEYTKHKILKLIEEKEKEGWTFVYLGANQDAWQEGTSISIPSDNIYDFRFDNPQDWKYVIKCSGSFIENDNIQTETFFKEE